MSSHHVVRDLTPEEIEHAKFLARRLGGVNAFGTECLALAENGWLTRGQYEALKVAKSERRHPRKSLGGRHSKRPITLARSAEPSS